MLIGPNRIPTPNRFRFGSGEQGCRYQMTSKSSSYNAFRRGALAIAALGLVLTATQLSAQTPNGLSQEVTAQIAALMADKATWTPAQQKLAATLVNQDVGPVEGSA